MKRLLSLLMFFLLTATSAPLFSQENNAEGADQKEKAKPTSVFQMGEIVVRDRALANIEDASTTTEITEADIKARGDKTLDQALQQVPGMNVYQTRKGQAGFTMRGFKHSKVVLLVDGLPFEEIYDGGGGDISRISVMNASKIVVNRGVSSALYGARGTFGTVNVITQKPDAMFTNISAEYGQHNNYMLNVSHGAPIGDFYYWITGSVMNSDGYDVSKKLDSEKRQEWFKKLTAYDVYGLDYNNILTSASNPALRNYINGGKSWDHTEYRKYYVSGKIGYNFTDSIEGGISAGYYQNKQLFLGYNPNALNVYEITSGGVGRWKANPTADNIFEQRAWEWEEDYRYDVSPYMNFVSGDFSLRTRVFYVEQMNNLYYWKDFDHAQIYTNGWKPSKHFESSCGFYIYPEYKVASWNKISSVIHYRRENFKKDQQDLVTFVPTGSYYKVRDMEASYITLGVEDEMKFNTDGGDVALTIGASYDAQKFNSFKKRSNSTDAFTDGLLPDEDSFLWGTLDSINPVAAILYEPFKDFIIIRGSAGMKVEFPSLSQISDNDKSAVTEKLKPERSINYNIGFELFFLDKIFSLRNDYFYTEFKDKLEKIRDPDGGPELVMNIDGRKMQGIESTAAVNIKNLFNLFDMSISQSYVYTYARDTDNSYVTKGKYVEECPEHQFITQLLFEFFTGTTLNIWGNYKMNEKFYVMKSNPSSTAVTVGDYSTAFYKTVELHDPLMFNIKISQKIMENYEVYVMCKNIFDDYNADPFNPGPGRMFYFGGSASF